MLIEFNDSNFNISSGLTILDFYADWCGPCNRLAPVIKKIAESNPNVTVGKVDIEACSIAKQYKIGSIPTILFFKDGKMVKKLVGYQSEQQLQGLIDQLK